MAVDEALLFGVAEAPPTLRLYTWERPSVSFGYRQSTPDWLARCTELGVGVVRRVSGGGAVLHAGDLTYAVVAPLGTPGLPDDLEGSYEWIRSAIVDGLCQLGLDARPSRGRPGAERQDVCFASPTGFEVELSGTKLVGSAQRRSGRGFLQHGSVRLCDDSELYLALLGESPPLPPLEGSTSPAAASRALLSALSRAVSGELVHRRLMPHEDALAKRLQDLRQRDSLATPGLSLTRFTPLADSST